VTEILLILLKFHHTWKLKPSQKLILCLQYPTFSFKERPCKTKNQKINVTSDEAFIHTSSHS